MIGRYSMDGHDDEGLATSDGFIGYSSSMAHFLFINPCMLETLRLEELTSSQVLN